MKKGFTLIETLVAIVVFTISLGAVSGLIVTSYRHYENVWQQALATNEARTGVEVMIKQIREARPGDDGSYPIVLAGDKEFSFFSDIDEDGETEKVRYFLGSVGSGSDSRSPLLQTENRYLWTSSIRLSGICTVPRVRED